MFNLDSKHAIRISSGDTAEFSIFINSGSRINPVRKSFNKNTLVSVSVYSSTITDKSVDSDTFFSKVSESGVHTFEYSSVWKYNEEEVDLSDFGISITGVPTPGDSIVISAQVASTDYIEFYIFPCRSDKYYICKKIQPSGVISTTYMKADETKETVSTSGNTTVDDEGDMIITLNSKDSSFIPVGNYEYCVKLVSDSDINTVTPRLQYSVVGV